MLRESCGTISMILTTALVLIATTAAGCGFIADRGSTMDLDVVERRLDGRWKLVDEKGEIVDGVDVSRLSIDMVLAQGQAESPDARMGRLAWHDFDRPFSLRMGSKLADGSGLFLEFLDKESISTDSANSKEWNAGPGLVIAYLIADDAKDDMLCVGYEGWHDGRSANEECWKYVRE